MNCRDAVDLIDAYIDGELDLVKSLEIEQHLGACPACRVQYDQVRELGSGIRARAVYHAAPPALHARIAAALPRERGATPRFSVWAWWRAAASLALLVVLAMGLGLVLRQPDSEDRLAREVVASHVRSLMADHLMDIASSDQHTVKPWIAGKLDFSPPVKDLAAQGYPLAGGRLDYLGERSVMALVYRRHGHAINLFAWPQSSAGDSGLRSEAHRGYNLVHFSRAGMVFWAVSDLNPEELQAFVALI